MPAMTEIYLCKDGQALREGKLELSTTITTKHEAERDARTRCEHDSWIKRIAYYSVDDSGNFKLFYSYTSEKAVPRKAPPVRVPAADPRVPLRPKRRVQKRRKSLLQRIASAFK